MFKLFNRAGSVIINRNSRLLRRRTQIDDNFQKIDQNRNIHFNRCLQENHRNRNMAGCTSDEPKYRNRLAQEKSPYLLQHAHNPVDWYPWGDEAIQKAKTENKLIFLSVGYSTCHWCHVMEHESFENEEVAKIMNENFVNIKVDREERPDIDKIYMNFVLMINGSGGWPMSVWLTPDLAPITAGTYFPPQDRWGMPGFKTVLTKIAQKWRDNQTELSSAGERIITAIRKSLTEKTVDTSSADPMSVEEKLKQCVNIYKKSFDRHYGGFGSAPKFPEVAKLNLLFHAYIALKDEDVVQMVLKTLRRIAKGGIHDHVFGGFARYSVDKMWHVPHFEKMLYDQGQLMWAYSEAYKLTNDNFYLDVADGIFRYMMKDLRHPGGGFYSGEDADSLPSADAKAKVEGAFYAWTYSEIRDVINANASKFEFNPEKTLEIYASHYDLGETGNILPSSDPHGHLTAKNILIVRRSEHFTAEKFKISKVQLQRLLKELNGILHEIRDKRPRPHLDTKIITAWNGLALSGLCKLANCDCPKKDEYREAARQLVYFIRTNLYDEKEKILYRSCYGEGNSLAELMNKPIPGFLDDYAFLIKGLIEFHKSTADITALEWAKSLQDKQDELFWDNEHGAYFYSQDNAANIVVRLKEDHDGAEPCGNSVAAKNLLLISVLFEEPSYKQRAQKLFEFFSDTKPFGYVLPEMMSALLLIDHGIEMAAVVGPDSPETHRLIDICRQYYVPGLLVIHFNTENPSAVKRKNTDAFKMINDKPTVYICHNRVCQLPVNDPNVLNEKLKANFVIN